jgi:hypothetical protein
MADKRPAHRKGTTGRDYRKLQAWVFRGTVCARCHNAKGPIVREPCDPAIHPSHEGQPYCPTHPLAPSLGHKLDCQHGGRTTKQNSQLEHFSCNSSAGVIARMAKERSAKGVQTQSWDW